MAFVSKMAEWVEVEGEPGCEFHLRPLSDPELQLAEEANMERGIKAMEMMAKLDPQIVKEWEGTQDDEKVLLKGLSLPVVLDYGLLGWKGPGYDDVALTPENKRDLDAGTMEWASLWILRRSRRTPGEQPASSEKSVEEPSPAS